MSSFSISFGKNAKITTSKPAHNNNALARCVCRHVAKLIVKVSTLLFAIFGFRAFCQLIELVFCNVKKRRTYTYLSFFICSHSPVSFSFYFFVKFFRWQIIHDRMDFRLSFHLCCAFVPKRMPKVFGRDKAREKKTAEQRNDNARGLDRITR